MPVNITKPTVGADVGTWGTELNAALDVLAAGVNAEETARAAADTALDGRLDVLEASPGGTSVLVDGEPVSSLPLLTTPVTAAQIAYTPSGTVSATTVQAAVSEVDTEKARRASVWQASTAYLAGELVTQGTTLYRRKTDGTSGASFDAAMWDVISPAAGAQAATITTQDEGSVLSTTATTLNFVGSGVTASGTGATTTVTIPGGAGGSALTVQDEGSPLASAADTLNFVGAGVTASGTGATKTITIPGGSGSAAPQYPLIVGRYYDGSTFYSPGASAAFITSRLYAAGWLVGEAVTIDALALHTNAANAGITIRLLVYGAATNGDPGAKLYESGDIDISASGGVVHTMTAPLALTPGQFYLCAEFSGSASGVFSRATSTGRLTGMSAATDANQAVDLVFVSNTYPTTPATFGTPTTRTLSVPSVRARILSKP